MRHDTTWHEFHLWESYGISAIIFDTCVRLSGAGSFARSRNIGSRECSEQTTTTCPCRSREVQLIRSSLKVISQARNRNHRRDRAYRLYVAASCHVPRWCRCNTLLLCIVEKRINAPWHTGAFDGKLAFWGGGKREGREEGKEEGNRPLVHSTFWRTRESEHPKPRLIGHNN